MAEIMLWVRSRLLQWRIGLLGGLCMLALWLPATLRPWPGSVGLLAGTALALAIFISAFRLLDDLADLRHDAVHHPERVLVQSRQRRGFFVLAAILLLIPVPCLLSLLSNPWYCAAYLLYLSLLLLMYYLSAGKVGYWRLARAQWVLLKYPLFVYCLTPFAAGWQYGHGWALLLLYLLLSWHEKAWQNIST